MEIPYVHTREKMLRIPCAEYKKFFYDCKLVDESYDAESNTFAIIIEVPISPKSFGKQFRIIPTVHPKRKYVVKGHGIAVYQYQTGPRARFAVSTFDPNHRLGSNKYDFSMFTETSIQGVGDLARTRAILLALALADTGTYKKVGECTK